MKLKISKQTWVVGSGTFVLHAGGLKFDSSTTKSQTKPKQNKQKKSKQA
jgi:hypothetical protein